MRSEVISLLFKKKRKKSVTSKYGNNFEENVIGIFGKIYNLNSVLIYR